MKLTQKQPPLIFVHVVVKCRQRFGLAPLKKTCLVSCTVRMRMHIRANQSLKFSHVVKVERRGRWIRERRFRRVSGGVNCSIPDDEGYGSDEKMKEVSERNGASLGHGGLLSIADEQLERRGHALAFPKQRLVVPDALRGVSG